MTLKLFVDIAAALILSNLPLIPCMLTPTPLSTRQPQALRTSTPWSIERSRRTKNQNQLHQRLCIRYLCTCCIITLGTPIFFRKMYYLVHVLRFLQCVSWTYLLILLWSLLYCYLLYTTGLSSLPRTPARLSTRWR